MSKRLTEEQVEALGPQSRLVYDYLVTERMITNLVALTNLGVGSLSSRISELRKLGLDIEYAWGQDHFEKRYKKYYIEGEAGDE